MAQKFMFLVKTGIFYEFLRGEKYGAVQARENLELTNPLPVLHCFIKTELVEGTG